MSLLQARGLVKRFGALAATDRLDLEVPARGVHAVIGPNGAGKSTLIGLLSGAFLPDAGEIILDGVRITRMPAARRARLGLTRSFQVTSVFPARTVRDNLALAVQAQDPDALSMWRIRPAANWPAATDEALAQVGLEDVAGRLVTGLSHGQLRLLEVGLALAANPKLVLLDEPMAGLGLVESGNMERLIEGLKGRMAVLLVEHDMDAVFRLADSLSVLVAGRVIATGTPSAIRADPAVRRAYLGDEGFPDVTPAAQRGGNLARLP